MNHCTVVARPKLCGKYGLDSILQSKNFPLGNWTEQFGSLSALISLGRATGLRVLQLLLSVSIDLVSVDNLVASGVRDYRNHDALNEQPIPSPAAQISPTGYG
jgi:hypothetical protein